MLGKSAKARLLFSGLLLAFVIYGCSSSTKDFPFGTYANSSGTSNYEFFADGTYTWGVNQNALSANGKYRVDGESFTFLGQDDGGCPRDGNYIWSFKDNLLRFELVEDSCGSRRLFHEGVRYFPTE